MTPATHWDPDCRCAVCLVVDAAVAEYRSQQAASRLAIGALTKPGVSLAHTFTGDAVLAARVARANLKEAVERLLEERGER